MTRVVFVGVGGFAYYLETLREFKDVYEIDARK